MVNKKKMNDIHTITKRLGMDEVKTDQMNEHRYILVHTHAQKLQNKCAVAKKRSNISMWQTTIKTVIFKVASY